MYKAKFQQLCLEFSFAKLQKRINEKFSRFSAINIDNMDESHPFQLVRMRINTIENRFTREENPIVEKPDHDNEKEWKLLWTSLVSAKIAIDRFLNAGGFHSEDINRAKNFFEYKSYLRQIESFANDIHVLLKAANSPQCKHLFTFKFEIRALAEQTWRTDNVPQTSEQWETVLEKALTLRNFYKGDGQKDLVIDIRKVREDTADMAKQAIMQKLVVHCEVKILTHL